MRSGIVLFLVAASATAAPAPARKKIVIIPRAVSLQVLYFAPAPVIPLEKALPFCNPSAGGTPVVSPATQDDQANASIAVARYPADRAPALDEKLIASLSVGVSAEERSAVLRSADPIIVRLSSPPATAARSLHDTEKFLACMADAMQALIWDDAERLLYGRPAFRLRRLQAWTDERAPVAAEISMRQYPHGDAQRSVTSGMLKLGLPDLVVDGHPQYLATQVLALMGRVAEALAADPRLARPGTLMLDGTSIKMVAGQRDSGDPQNVLLGLELGDAAQQAALFEKGAKGEKPIIADTDDPELSAVQKKAQDRLTALAGEMKPQPPAGTLFAVKGLFTAADGRVEFMWVEVRRWEKDQLTGVLTNEPFYVTTLHEGDKVTVAQSDIGDYILKRRGKPPEGGDSDKIIEARQKQGK